MFHNDMFHSLIENLTLFSQISTNIYTEPLLEFPLTKACCPL